MTTFAPPSPVIDSRETDLITSLTADYEKLVAPGPTSRLIRKTWGRLPDPVRQQVGAFGDSVMEQQLIAKTLEFAGRGFSELNRRAAGIGLSKDHVLRELSKHGHVLADFSHIAALRSYSVQTVVSRNDWKHWTMTIAEGGATGAPGLPGLPFNIALSMLLYYRAVQAIALHYGYDVKDDPGELEIAAAITSFCFSPTATPEGVDTVAGLMGKMMLAANLTALRQALSNKTLTEMARHGGTQLLYVQVRALANGAAQKALSNAGTQGLEQSTFRNLLSGIGQRLPMETAKKSIPVVGAVLGALSDTYYMFRVLRIANLIYHKRFLFEKEERVARLSGGAV